ncbi:MAG: hypothetical protein GH145_04355 [Firmicutes bacterium]|nr:hypothetical protein [Bacillota bacterium]
MSPRERFLITLNHKEPDRVPTFTNLTPQTAEKLGKKMNLPWEAEDSWLSTRISHTEILLISNLILPWKISMPILRLLKNTEPIPLAFNDAASFF